MLCLAVCAQVGPYVTLAVLLGLGSGGAAGLWHWWHSLGVYGALGDSDSGSWSASLLDWPYALAAVLLCQFGVGG